MTGRDKDSSDIKYKNGGCSEFVTRIETFRSELTCMLKWQRACRQYYIDGCKSQGHGISVAVEYKSRHLLEMSSAAP